MIRNWIGMSCLMMVLAVGANPAFAETRLRMATTTSTENSGLLAVLNPPFEQQYQVKLDVIAVGTGKALRLGADGDADIVFVHAPAAEKRFVAAGHGVDRTAVMHNDFVILGPESDPAGLAEAISTEDALKRISRSGAIFVSRGDDSGTHKKEMALWKSAGIMPQGAWYNSAGQGMGAVLIIASEKGAYTLTDRGTFIAMLPKINLGVRYEGDEALFNPYHVMAVNPKKHPHVQYELAKQYIDFVSGPEGQSIIARYRKGGQQLFYPDAIPDAQ